MRLYQEEFDHPTQATRARLNIYEYGPGDAPAVSGLGPERPGFLLTEDRIGAVTVVATLGFFATGEEARAAALARRRELEEQSYRARSTAG
jgi:hypothetical protein